MSPVAHPIFARSVTDEFKSVNSWDTCMAKSWCKYVCWNPCACAHSQQPFTNLTALLDGQSSLVSSSDPSSSSQSWAVSSTVSAAATNAVNAAVAAAAPQAVAKTSNQNTTTTLPSTNLLPQAQTQHTKHRPPRPSTAAPHKLQPSILRRRRIPTLTMMHSPQCPPGLMQWTNMSKTKQPTKTWK